MADLRLWHSDTFQKELRVHRDGIKGRLKRCITIAKAEPVIEELEAIDAFAELIASQSKRLKKSLLGLVSEPGSKIVIAGYFFLEHKPWRGYYYDDGSADILLGLRVFHQDDIPTPLISILEQELHRIFDA